MFLVGPMVIRTSYLQSHNQPHPRRTPVHACACQPLAVVTPAGANCLPGTGRGFNSPLLLAAAQFPHQQPTLKHIGLPRMRFHDLRHTAATLLLGRGINPKIVSEMWEHSQVGSTLGLYSHVTPHMQQQAADAMDEALGRYRSSTKNRV